MSRYRKKKRKILAFVIFLIIIFLILYILKSGGIILNANINEDVFDEVTTSKENTTTTTTIKKEKYEIKTIDGVTFVDGILIVNKTYPLPNDYVPKDTYKDATGFKYCSECLNTDAYNEFNEMKSDAIALGLNIWIQSGYRSYELQDELYNSYVNRDGKEAADTYSARPGHSEHQTGLAFDLNTITDDFKDTDEGKWVNDNAWRYGFILRYPKGKEDKTGYKYEPWHLRYVGKDLASKLYNDGEWITLEEHFNLTSKYKD